MAINRLTPAEVSNLWNSYITNTMGIVVSRHFISVVQDKEILKMLQFSEEIAMKETKKSKNFLIEAGHPLPRPFTREDINEGSKPLFTDTYIVLLKYGLAQAAVSVYSLSLSTSTRADIRSFYQQCLENASTLLNKCQDILNKKGLNHPEIYLPAPDDIEKIDSQEYLAGWFTDRRPINAHEIGLLVYNFRATEIHKEFIKGAAQVTKSEDLKKHFERGVQMLQKQLNVFQSLLSENGLPKLPTWETEVINTTISPFSDRILHYKHAALISASAGRYGVALSSSMRRDIAAHYMRIFTETLIYAEDAANLMIKHKFMDKLPTFIKKPQ